MWALYLLLFVIFCNCLLSQKKEMFLNQRMPNEKLLRLMNMSDSEYNAKQKRKKNIKRYLRNIRRTQNIYGENRLNTSINVDNTVRVIGNINVDK